jgi:hypothetical protein
MTDARYYAKTVNVRGWPTCHFAMDRTTWTAVTIRRTIGAARKDARRLNEQAV